MRKRLLCIVLLTAMFLSTIPAASAAAPFVDPQYAAERLYYYGLFKGTENGFELDRGLTRLEALVMITRLEGLEDIIYGGWAGNPPPFVDVPEWGKDYVAFGYGDGLINGTSPNTFGSYDNISAEQFVTMLLRLLSYRDDFWVFHWDNPWPLAQEIGLVNPGEYPKGAFTRGDAAKLCYRTLRLPTWMWDRRALSERTRMAQIGHPDYEMNRGKWDQFGVEFSNENISIDANEDMIFLNLKPGDIVDGWMMHCGDRTDQIQLISSNQAVVKSTVLTSSYSEEYAQGTLYKQTSLTIRYSAVGAGRAHVRINLLDANGNLKDFTYAYVTVEASLSNFTPSDYPLHPGVPDFGSVVGAWAEDYTHDSRGEYLYTYKESNLLWGKYSGTTQFLSDYIQVLTNAGFNVNIYEDLNAGLGYESMYTCLFGAENFDGYYRITVWRHSYFDELHVRVQHGPRKDPFAQ